MTTESNESLAVVGGTGELGGALVRRLARGGRTVIIGSRTAERAATAARDLSRELGIEIAGDENGAAARAAGMVLVAVPYAAQAATLLQIRPVVQGKIVIDTTVPLVPPKVMRVQLPSEGCAALIAQRILGPEVRVVSAFHNVAARKLAADGEVDCDVLVFGDDRSAREAAVQLVRACGLRALHGGSLANSAAAEALTSVLIFLNKTYSVEGAGIRITGALKMP
ncbi:MAG: NADPH-dependent F420 reductase [Steroidobacteraceae bacterium]